MIGAIEQAMVDRIQAASDGGVLGYALKKVISYGGEFDEDINQVVRDFPAVWVVFSGRNRPTRRVKGLWPVTSRFTVVGGTRSRRNERARRRGEAGEVGSYQIVEDVEGLLIGQTLGLDIDPVEPAGIRSLFQGVLRDKQISLYALDLDVGHELELPAPAGGLDDFAGFHVDWDIPPLGNVVPPPPAADPDAEDNVTLETA